MSAAVVAAAAAQVAMAVKASGTIVSVEPDAFVAILKKQDGPLVVHATARLGRKRHRYLTSYKGLAFFAEAREPLALPRGVELVVADKIWIP